MAVFASVSLCLAAFAAAPAPTVAVLYFDYEGQDRSLEVLKKGLSQMLISDLEGPGIRLVERSRLEDVLKELKLQKTRRFDAATRVKVGRLLGARYLVVGGFFDLGPSFRLDARLLDVKTGVVVGTKGATGPKTDIFALEQTVAQGMAEALKALPAAEKGPARPKGKPGPKKKSKTKKEKKPTELALSTALRYSRGLDALDKEDKATAKRELEAVVKAAPDFSAARLDLAALVH